MARQPTQKWIVLLWVLLATSATPSGIIMASDPGEIDSLDEIRREYYLLQHLKLTYSKEVFEYCVDRHASTSSQLQRCMLRQEGIKTKLLDRALRELGRRSLAEALYYECLDYYYKQSINKTADCVDARLILRERLNQKNVEAEIYRRCNTKWYKHGTRAVRNCAIHGANYYRDKGEYRD